MWRFIALGIGAAVAGALGVRLSLTRARLLREEMRAAAGPPGTWWSTQLPSPRIALAAVAEDERVLFFGGHDHEQAAVRRVDAFDPARRRWGDAGQLLLEYTWGFSATALDSGEVLLVEEDRAELYDPRARTSRRIEPPHIRRAQHVAALDGRGRVLIAGGSRMGSPADGAILREAELFDPERGWRVIEPMSVARNAPSAVRIAGGRVLVAGGSREAGEGILALDDTEIFEPDTELWTRAAPMTTRRHAHTLTLLLDGAVLAIGGDRGEGDVLDTVERFDPNLGAWRKVGFLTAARRHHTATLLPDGRVLVVGATDAADAPFAEIYDPTTNTSKPLAADLRAPPHDHATVCVGRTVVIAGGEPVPLALEVWEVA